MTVDGKNTGVGIHFHMPRKITGTGGQVRTREPWKTPGAGLAHFLEVMERILGNFEWGVVLIGDPSSCPQLLSPEIGRVELCISTVSPLGLP